VNLTCKMKLVLFSISSQETRKESGTQISIPVEFRGASIEWRTPTGLERQSGSTASNLCPNSISLKSMERSVYSIGNLLTTTVDCGDSLGHILPHNLHGVSSIAETLWFTRNVGHTHMYFLKSLCPFRFIDHNQ